MLLPLANITGILGYKLLPVLFSGEMYNFQKTTFRPVAAEQ
jgi:hypothetical protein